MTKQIIITLAALSFVACGHKDKNKAAAPSCVPNATISAVDFQSMDASVPLADSTFIYTLPESTKADTLKSIDLELNSGEKVSIERIVKFELTGTEDTDITFDLMSQTITSSQEGTLKYKYVTGVESPEDQVQFNKFAIDAKDVAAIQKSKVQKALASSEVSAGSDVQICSVAEAQGEYFHTVPDNNFIAKNYFAKFNVRVPTEMVKKIVVAEKTNAANASELIRIANTSRAALIDKMNAEIAKQKALDALRASGGSR